MKKLDREAVLRVERTRWFIVALALSIVSLASIWSSCSANKRAMHDIKVVWVKMYPDGTWDVEYFDEQKGMEFFPATVDHMLRNFVVRRYSEVPYSIKSDYGYVYKLMSNNLQNEFKDEFQAIEKAENYSICKNCTETKIAVRTIDHYDSDKTNFHGNPGTLYRTNVFITNTPSKNGMNLPSKKYIVPITWRIKTKGEHSFKQLKDNPIRLEVMSYELLSDDSQ